MNMNEMRYKVMLQTGPAAEHFGSQGRAVLEVARFACEDDAKEYVAFLVDANRARKGDAWVEGE